MFKISQDRHSGSSNIEVIVMMILLILFASSIYTMIFASSMTQSRILEEREAQSNARVATSYLNVKFKQNDVPNKVEIRENPLTGEDAIIIKDALGDGLYETWIYLEDGVLREQLVDLGGQPLAGLGFDIAELNDFYVEKVDNFLYVEIAYEENGAEEKMECIYTFKTDQD